MPKYTAEQIKAELARQKKRIQQLEAENRELRLQIDGQPQNRLGPSLKRILTATLSVVVGLALLMGGLKLFDEFSGSSDSNRSSPNYSGGYVASNPISSLISPPIVTKSEFSQIQNGMSYREVVAIIGAEGEELTSNTIEGVPGLTDEIVTVMYMWGNADGANMNAMFQNDKLIQKSQFGLTD